jgi:hypothetical protein
MDCLSNSIDNLEIPALGIEVSVVGARNSYGCIQFKYKDNNEIIEIQSLNIEKFWNLLQSQCLGMALYKIEGISYIEDTEICVRFDSYRNNLFNFSILSGDEIIYEKNDIDFLIFVEQVGKFGRSVYGVLNTGKCIQDFLGNPEICFYFPS